VRTLRRLRRSGSDEVVGELSASLVELGLEGIRNSSLLLELLEDVRVSSLDVLDPGALEGPDLVELDLVQESTNTGVDDDHLLLHGHGGVLGLLEQLLETRSTVELLEGLSVEVGSELSEGSDLTVLGELELDLTGDLLHGLDLGSGSNTGHGETDVNGGAEALVEELSLQEDLAVSDGNNVGGNVSGHITSLGLDDGQGGQGSGAEGIGDLGGTLEETRVEVENVSGVSLTSRRATEQEGHLTVGNGLLGQVVVDDNSVAARVTEVLSDGGSRVGGQELQGSRVRGSGGNDDRILVGLVLGDTRDDLGDSRALLSDGNVHAVQVLLLVGVLVDLLLVDDGVDGDGSLSDLTITNDQLTLSTTDGDQRVDGLETSLHRLVHGLTGQDTRGLDLNTVALGSLDGSLSVDGLTESIDSAAEERVSDGHVNDGSGTLDDVSLQDLTIVSEDNDSNVVVLQVEGHALDAGLDELNHLSGLNRGETVDTGDTVSNADDVSDLRHIGSSGSLVVRGNAGLEDSRLYVRC